MCFFSSLWMWVAVFTMYRKGTSIRQAPVFRHLRALRKSSWKFIIWMNEWNYTACCWFSSSNNIVIPSSQFWQIRFESCWLHCSKCRILVFLRYVVWIVENQNHYDAFVPKSMFYSFFSLIFFSFQSNKLCGIHINPYISSVADLDGGTSGPCPPPPLLKPKKKEKKKGGLARLSRLAAVRKKKCRSPPPPLF